MKAGIWASVKASIKNSNEWLFWFTTLWTLVQLTLFWAEFITHGKFKITYETTVIYLGFLGTYVATKEIGKWCGQLVHIDRPGELLMYVWGFSALIMSVIKFFYPACEYPGELIRVVLGVLAVFATSGVSKAIRNKYNDKQNKVCDCEKGKSD